MSHGDIFIPRRFVIAEFSDSDALLAGTKAMREKGFKRLDTHTPYPIHGIEEALGLGRPKIPTIVLFAGLAGACVAYAMMYYMNVLDWPINVGNRPPHAVPAFIPITFELTILFGGCSAFFGVIALMGLPQPYHPVFEWDRFHERASVNGFFLSVELMGNEKPEDVLEAVRAVGATESTSVEESER